MAAIGTVWGAGTWSDDIWGDGTWGAGSVINNLDSALERISAVNVLMPWRHIGVTINDYTSFHVGKRQGAAWLYGGSWAVKYGWGIEVPYVTNAIEAETNG